MCTRGYERIAHITRRDFDWLKAGREIFSSVSAPDVFGREGHLVESLATRDV